MSVAASMLEAPDLGASPAARWTSAGRAAAAGTLVLGAAFQLAAFITEPKYDETIDRLRWIANSPDRADLAKTFDLLAMPFLLGTRARLRAPHQGALPAPCLRGRDPARVRHGRPDGRKGYEILQFKLAQDGRFDLTALADAVDDTSPPLIAMLLLFIPGAIFGLLTFTVALWRSRAVPRGAVLLIPAFIVVDIFLSQGLAGHAISFAAACWIASAVLLAGRAPPTS